MKNWKKIVLAATSAVLACGMAVAVAACGVSGDPYTFEAEDAELGGAATVEGGKHFWTDDIATPGDELTQVGYFTEEGATITFTVTAEAAAKVELNLRIASAAMDQAGMMTGGDFIVKSIDLKTQKVFTLTVNDKEVEVTGTLPEIKLAMSDVGENFMNLFDAPLCNYQDVKVVVDLKAGENKIVLAATGLKSEDGAINYGVNVDKIIITSPTKLS